MALVSLPGGPSAPSAPYGTTSFSGEPRAGGSAVARFTPAPKPAAPTGYSYTTALRNDPFLQPYLGGLKTQGAANTVGYGTTQSGLIGRYGEVPSAQTLGFTPSQEARDLAAASTAGGYSTTAQLAQQLGQTNAADAARAAAQGLNRSGFVGQYTQQNNDAYALQRAQALDALLGQLGTARSDYLTGQGDLRDKAYQATTDAYDRQVAATKAGQIGSGVPPRSVTGLPSQVGGTGPVVRPIATRRATASGTRGGGQLGY